MRRLVGGLLVAALVGGGLLAGPGLSREVRTHLAAGYTAAVVTLAYPAAVAADLADAGASQHLTIRALATGRVRITSWDRWWQPGTAARYRALQAASPRAARVRRWTLWLALALALLLLVRLGRPLLRLVVRVGRRLGRIRVGRSAGSAGWGRWYVWWRLHVRRRETPFVLGRIGPFGLGPRMGLRQADQARNAILWGPPGTGKTRFIIANLLRLSPRHRARLPSLTITDSKGAVYAAVAGWLARLGYRVVRIDWLDPSSDGYNSLDPAHIQEPADAFAWAESLIENTGRNADTPFWDQSTTLLLVATLAHLLEEHGTATARDVQRFLAQPIATVKAILRHSNSLTAREAAVGLLSYMKQNERLEGSVFAGPPLKFMALWDERIAQTTSRNSIVWRDLVDPAQPPPAVFVVLPPGYEPLLRPFVGAFFAQMHTELLRAANRAVGPRKQLPRRVMNWWDEAGTIGRITDLPARLNTTREAGIGTVLGIQSTTQLDELYGEMGRKVILQGAYAHLILPGLRAEQAEAVAAALGQATVAQRQGGATREGGDLLFRQGSMGLTERGRPLLTADEVRRLWGSQLLAIVGNLRPLRLWWPGRWYGNPILRRRSRLAPPTAGPPAALSLPAAVDASIPGQWIDWSILDG